MLFSRNGSPTDSKRRRRHRRGQEHKIKLKIKVKRDHENMKRCDRARETAVQAYNKGNYITAQNGMIDVAENSIKEKISIWRVALERAYDKMNSKINELLEQIKESDKRAQVLNKGFYDNVITMNTAFHSDLAALNKESAKRNVGFMSKTQAHKFTNDLKTLHKENEKRNVGFHCKKNKVNHDSKFKQMCEESYKRNDIYKNRKESLGLDKMKMMNENRTAAFMARRPDSKFEAAMSMNNKRAAGFRQKKPLTKLEEVTMWNGQRNALFNLRD